MLYSTDPVCPASVLLRNLMYVFYRQTDRHTDKETNTERQRENERGINRIARTEETGGEKLRCWYVFMLHTSFQITSQEG